MNSLTAFNQVWHWRSFACDVQPAYAVCKRATKVGNQELKFEGNNGVKTPGFSSVLEWR